MDAEIQDLIKNMELSEGANQSDIEKLLRLRVNFPSDYIEFLKYANGAEGSIGAEGYLSISSVDEVIVINKELKSSDLESQILLFASDGAGVWYAFKKGVSTAIVEIDLYDISPDSFVFRASNFKDFLKFVASQNINK
jgi:hypothetical protein